MVLATEEQGGSLDPGTNADGNGWEKILLMYDPLVRIKSESPAALMSGTPLGAVEPWLAQSWRVSPDGLTWTFNLRRGVQFHDGTPLTADSVVVNIDRYVNDSNPYYYKGRMVNAQFLYSSLASYRAVDPNTVELTLKQPYAPLLRNLANPTAGIASPAALKKYGQDLATHPVGSGPFQFVEQVTEDHITLQRNPKWWGGQVYLDRVIFRTAAEASSRLVMLQKGEAEFIEAPGPDDIPKIQSDPNLQILRAPGGINYVLMQNQKKPFTDVRVRQALNYAINKVEMNQTLYNGLGAVANSPMIPLYSEYDSSMKPYPYDPQKAKDLLAAAGYPNGFEAHLSTYIGTQAYNPAGGVPFAEAIQQYLSMVNVKVSVDQVDLATWSQLRLNGNYEMLCGGWFGTNLDPDGYFFPAFHSSQIPGRNSAQVRDPKLDAMIIAAQEEYDEKKRLVMYREIQRYVMDAAPWIFVNYPFILNGASKRVNDLGLYYLFLRDPLRAWLSS